MDVLLIGMVLAVGAFLDLIIHEKTYRRGARGRSSKIDLNGQGDEPEPLSGLA
ncbi:MAG TPA: hypothetical protein VLG68_03740 [Gammaproteobacteria bacterium]|nr:hypothetical protein [Gammaproteobacteria bacterium]